MVAIDGKYVADSPVHKVAIFAHIVFTEKRFDNFLPVRKSVFDCKNFFGSCASEVFWECGKKAFGAHLHVVYERINFSPFFVIFVKALQLLREFACN